jgi:pimeloyl-ACP methyl ester carboxylesterase
MRRVLPFLLACGFMFFCSDAPFAQDKKPKDKKDKKGKFDPPANLIPSDEMLKQIRAKTRQLADKIAELRAKKDSKIDTLLPDVEIYLRGAENIVRFKEYYNKDSGKWTLDSLDRGLDRAEQLARHNDVWVHLKSRNVVRGYRSIIDGTAQPYGVTYPLEYGNDPNRKWRVDVVLHGRNASLTEVAFLNSHNGNKKVAADQDWVQIDIFGRGNNAYRWSGETDVLEALEAFFAGEQFAKRGDLPDRRKVVLRGFSMGGAGTWHLGLHHPDKWCVMGPGAGFTTTHGYAGGLPNPLPDYQEPTLRIYDAVDYVENARMIPIVAYSGGEDAQKLAADNIEKRLKELKIDAMTHLVAPGLGHTFPPYWFKKANALWSERAAKGREAYPKKVAFVTYTTKYATCDWVEILGLDKHYKKASVVAETSGTDLRVTTENVRALHLTLAKGTTGVPRVFINNKEEPAIVVLPKNGTRHLYYTQQGGKWTAMTRNESVKYQEGTLQKRHGLQGPIDDAFASGFVCVIGSGDAWHPSTKKYVDAKVAAFKKDWAKHWRGELPTTGDYAVNPNDLKDKHMILFGDPSSNLTLAQMLPKLPLKWTKDEIEFAGKTYKSADHVPVLIFPNPLNPGKYVVLNTGHTIPSEDYTKTNAMLFPRLGDYAILRMTPNAKNAAAYEVATAGLFNEFWQVK